MYKKIVITGASHGLGRGLSMALAGAERELFLVGRDQKALEELSGTLPGVVHTYALDLANSEQRKEVVEIIHTHCPDLVINNAGRGLYGAVTSHGIEDELSMLRVNVEALFELTIEAAGALKRSGKKGVIFNVASVAAFFQPFPYLTTYAASKSFVLSFSQGMDYELRGEGIRVLTSCPGQVVSRFRERASEGKLGNEEHMMSLSYAIKRMLRQLKRGKSVDVFDWRYRGMSILARCLPRCILNKVLAGTILR